MQNTGCYITLTDFIVSLGLYCNLREYLIPDTHVSWFGIEQVEIITTQEHDLCERLILEDVEIIRIILAYNLVIDSIHIDSLSQQVIILSVDFNLNHG